VLPALTASGKKFLWRRCPGSAEVTKGLAKTIRAMADGTLLSQGKCRWPISNPGAEDFCFCGNEPVKGLPYCLGHARIAYRSVGRQRSSRRERRDELARFIQSLRPRNEQCLRYCEAERFRGLEIDD
jgi:GcrA cell cycle regulator